ncbi:hypothetical protein D3C76_1198350 [compost metagenome]
MTITTISSASSRVLVTSSMDAWMKRAVSNASSALTSGGRVLRMSGSTLRIPSTITSGLPPGVGNRPRCTARTPSMEALVSTEAAPSSTVPTSLMRTRPLPSLRITSSRNSPTLVRSVLTRMLETTNWPLTLPGAAW